VLYSAAPESSPASGLSNPYSNMEHRAINPTLIGINDHCLGIGHGAGAARRSRTKPQETARSGKKPQEAASFRWRQNGVPALMVPF
jgi:hypothetical protein